MELGVGLGTEMGMEVVEVGLGVEGGAGVEVVGGVEEEVVLGAGVEEEVGLGGLGVEVGLVLGLFTARGGVFVTLKLLGVRGRLGE